MENEIPSNIFNYLSESQEFLEFMEIFNQLTGMPIGLCHPKDITHGKAYYGNHDFNPICQLIRSTPKGKLACHETDESNCNLAHILKHGICYNCHAGLVDFVVPIYLGNQHVATIMCGQILSERPSKKGFLKIYKSLMRFSIDKKKLQEAYFKSPYMPPEKLECTLKLLSLIAGYFCEIAHRLNSASRNEKYPEIAAAKQYIHQNYQDQIKLYDVADYVGFSQGYFSRLFKKVNGVSFTDFLQKTRIEKAKKLLVETHMMVTKIAFESGFSSIQSFYQTFQRSEHCSPSQYRKSQTQNRHKPEQSSVDS